MYCTLMYLFLVLFPFYIVLFLVGTNIAIIISGLVNINNPVVIGRGDPSSSCEVRTMNKGWVGKWWNIKVLDEKGEGRDKGFPRARPGAGNSLP